MTNAELMQVVGTLALSQQKTDLQLRETDRYLQESKAETDRELRELSAHMKASKAETHRALRELSAQTAETDRVLRESGAETDRRLQETAQEIQEAARGLQRLQEQTDRVDKQLSELGKQIGELGNKFGSFTEGMAYPSMRKLLEERFGAQVVGPGIRSRQDGRTLELDVLAYSNSTRNEAYIVEVKSHLREDGIEQMLRILGDFPEFYPEHRSKQLYGILAVVNASEALRKKALNNGLYLAQISGDAFELCVPEGFVPRSFQQPDAAT